MPLGFCARCPRRTNQDRVLCHRCAYDDRHTRSVGRPRRAQDVPAAEIERVFAAAKAAIRRGIAEAGR